MDKTLKEEIQMENEIRPPFCTLNVSPAAEKEWLALYRRSVECQEQQVAAVLAVQKKQDSEWVAHTEIIHKQNALIIELLERLVSLTIRPV